MNGTGLGGTGRGQTAKAVCTKDSDSSMMHYVGLDMHKKFMQMAVMDPGGKILKNKRVECDLRKVAAEVAKIPENARYVLESSSVWYGMYRFLTDNLGLDVMLSNPLATKRIAESKKKTDKVDAAILADLLRGGYIAGCHIPDEDVVKDRQLIRYRDKVVRARTKAKNGIHAILLQKGIKISGTPFTPQHIHKLRMIGDWRIEKHLETIAFLNRDVSDCDSRIQDAVSKNKSAKLLRTMPGIGNITALALASEIDDVSRFSDADHLASYFGLVPSVRNSASTTHHGSITKTGNSIVRHLLVEAVIVHVGHARKRKVPTPVSTFYERLAKKRGGPKAKVAAAAKVLRIVFWMLKKEVDFWTCVEEGRKSTHRAPKKGAQNGS